MEFDLQYYKSLPSTNLKAVKDIQEGTARHGIVIWTEDQTQGRGNGTNQWESEKGKNLTFSLVIEPHFLHPAEQFFITQLISVALYDTLKKILSPENLSIKWPNDLYYENKKIAGVLIQNYVKGPQINFAVIGVGLNVNQNIFLSDAPNPASLIQFTGKENDIRSILNELLQTFKKYYELLQDPQKRVKMHEKYLEHLYLKDQWANFSDESGTFSGKIKGINDYGQLIIEERDGNHRAFGFKEVKLEQ
ncbi:MAG: biotin--[acetyl-CoA-carboxylase] ligase [Bacteroidales bacterium]|nr:biotin--[acetyl-CoA-carboxylase] ligase [Bacteroidales bacterium]